MNHSDLFKRMKRATIQTFQEFQGKSLEEEIWVFALYSDESAMTVCASVDTKTIKQNLEYFELEPSEWRYEMIGAERNFNLICESFSNQDLEIETEQEFKQFQSFLYQTCLDSLHALRTVIFFKTETGLPIFIQFYVSDSELNFCLKI